MPATDIRTALSQQRQSQQQSSWRAILKASATEWVDADSMTWAAAIACYTVLALAPMLVVAVKVGTFVLRQGNAVQKIRDAATQWIGPDGATAVGAILDRMAQQRSGTIAAIISGILIVVSVGGVFAEIQQAMNRVWKLKPKPGKALIAFVRARFKSIVVLGFAALLILASVVAAEAIKNWSKDLGMGWTFVGWTIDFVATVVVLTIIFGMVFKTVPDAEIEWHNTIVGALITAFLFALGKHGLTLYFKFAAPASAFGAVGSLAAVLIWIYYSAQIALFGAVFTEVYAKHRGRGVRPSKHAEFLSACDETETATPSDEPPWSKPTRPGPRSVVGQAGRRSPNEAGYAAVLGRHAPPTHAEAQLFVDPQAGSERAVIRNLVVAGAGVVLGALLGGYGALQMRKPKSASPRQLADARLRRRLDAVQQRITRASRTQKYLEAEDVNERLDEIEQEIRSARSRRGRRLASRPLRRDPWTARLAEAVKSYL